MNRESCLCFVDIVGDLCCDSNEVSLKNISDLSEVMSKNAGRVPNRPFIQQVVRGALAHNRRADTAAAQCYRLIGHSERKVAV